MDESQKSGVTAGSSRSDDCGRQDGGRFGSGNTCAAEDGSSATATKSGSSLLESNKNSTWSPASSGEPFPGASRYSDIRASGGLKVSESLEEMGLQPEDAISLTGAPDRASVFVRPAPEFAGKLTSPVFIGFDADVAGVRRGLEVTSVVGTQKNADTGEQEIVVRHSVWDVLPSVRETEQGRNDAARAFYRTMAASIQNARASGVAEISFSAAGDSSNKDGFRGYTIWPRMGFDGPLPKSVVSRLPPSLSSARTLLQLHATREGTKWWAENGEDIDVSMRLDSPSSAQRQIVDRFLRHFASGRRAVAAESREPRRDWLSAADAASFDEVWEEIWRSGVLSDQKQTSDRDPQPRGDLERLSREAGVRSLKSLPSILSCPEGAEIRTSSFFRYESGSRRLVRCIDAANSLGRIELVDGSHASLRLSFGETDSSPEAAFERSLDCLIAAEACGIPVVKIDAVGPRSSPMFARLGFDAPIPQEVRCLLPEQEQGRDSMQSLLSSPSGWQCWADRGHSSPMSIDFRDKDSIGYRRYANTTSAAGKASLLGVESRAKFLRHAARPSVVTNLSDWAPVARADIEARASSLVDFLSRRKVFD